MSLLKWTNKSTYKITDELRKLEHKIYPDTIGRILKENDYSLQANKNNIEGSSVLERDAQFRYISLSAGIYKNSIISSDGVSVNYMLMRDCRKNDQNGIS